MFNDHRSTSTSFIKVSILLFLFANFIACQVKASTSSTAGESYKPAAIEPTEYRVLHHPGEATNDDDDDDARRRLAPFQLCLLCKCCTTTSTTSTGSASATAAVASTCTTMPCCFGIDCQLPNKPFGVCAFVPKTCNYNSCAT